MPAGVCLLVLTASAASAQVQLSLRDGRVTVVATNATVRQILAEWARVGQTKIVNVERIPGGPLTLELTDVPEQEALDILLRSVTGYMAAPRPVAVASLSRYDRILVLPTAATARPPASASPAPVFQQPAVQPRVIDDQDEDERPSIVQPPRGPLFPTFQQPPQGSPQPGGADRRTRHGSTACRHRAIRTASPTTPANRPGVFNPAPGGTAVGTPRPGMVAASAAGPGRRSSSPASSRPRRTTDSVLMAFIDELNTAIADAMRSRDQIRLVALRMLKAALVNREIDRGRPLDDGEARQVVGSLVKQRKDSIEQFTKGGRQDLADKEAAEIRVLESYLPPSADPAAVERAVIEAIAETGATSPKDMGRVMKAAMAKLAGQSVDGKSVNELVRQKLAGA